MSSIRNVSSEDRTCGNCSHLEICKYKDDFIKTYNEIKQIGLDNEVYITVTVNCKHWNGKIYTVR